MTQSKSLRSYFLLWTLTEALPCMSMILCINLLFCQSLWVCFFSPLKQQSSNSCTFYILPNFVLEKLQNSECQLMTEPFQSFTCTPIIIQITCYLFLDYLCSNFLILSVHFEAIERMHLAGHIILITVSSCCRQFYSLQVKLACRLKPCSAIQSNPSDQLARQTTLETPLMQSWLLSIAFY